MRRFVKVSAVLAGFLTLALSVLLGGFVSLTESSRAAAQCITTPGVLPERVPQPLNSIFTQAAAHYDVDPLAVAVIYHTENAGYREPPPPYGTGKPWPTSSAGARGPMQFLPGTFRAYQNSNPANQPGDVLDLIDATYATARYLADVGAKAGTPLGDPSSPSLKPSLVNAFASYHSGPAFKTLGSYGRKYVTDAYKEYQRLQNESIADATVAPLECEPNPEFQLASDAQTKGYPNSDHLQCAAGTDLGVFKTAKGNTVRICDVRGFTVNASISGQVNALLATAPPELELKSTSGFRSLEKQTQLRKAHCGPTRYDIYERPSGQCSPPTAKPGESEHEQGLAIDIASNGRLIRSRNSPAFRWLDANAATYGLYNLPSEPWHWSTSGT